MTLRFKVYNSTKFSPNPWIPSNTLYYTPKLPKRVFVTLAETGKLNRNMCRLCLLFPTIKVHHILKILKIHHYKVTEAIDTLLLIKNIQIHTPHHKRKSQYRRHLDYIRTSTSARCTSFKSKQLIQSILEEDAVEEDRTIIPNITFGTNFTNVIYEYDLNFNVHAEHIPELNISQPEELDVPVRNNGEEILEVVDPTPPPSDPSTTNGNIILRVRKETSGLYRAQLLQ